MGSLLVHSSHSFLLLFLLRYPTFFVFSIFFFYFQCFSLLFFPLVLVVPYCAQLRHFYIACHDKIYHFTLQLLLAYCGCPFRTVHWLAGCLATTTTLCWLCHIPLLDKGNFVLFSSIPWHSHPDKDWVFSITNSYNTHLVIPAHVCLFWVICHPSRTFPLQELEWEP